MAYWEVHEHEAGPEYVWACISDAGSNNRAALRVVARVKYPQKPDALVLHQRGSKCWGGRGMGRDYIPAEYIVLRRAYNKDGHLYEEIIRFPVRGRAG